MQQGFTIVGVGWEFDVAGRDGAVGIDAPAPRDGGQPVRGTARATFIPDSSAATATVECASCHNPHNNSLGNFLRKANTGSAICLSCHIK